MTNIEKTEWIDEFLAYMDKFDPQFKNKIRGANETEIKEIENNLDISLPKTYREYLENMGQSDGGLFESSRAKTDVKELLELIKIIREERPGVDFKNFIPVASCDNIEGWALTKKNDRWQVVTIDNNLPGDYVANSFPDLVFYTAFSEKVHLALHQIHFKVPNKKINLSDIKEQTSSFGFIAESFCDDISYFGVKNNNILLMIHTGIAIGFDGFIASNNLDVIKQEADKLIAVFEGVILYVR